jgi:quercetin dioxygenase-like cupin family protein
MERYKLEDFTKGWILGNFQPAVYNTGDFELGVKFFTQGEIEPAHKQIVATEITVVVSGQIRLAKEFFFAGDVISIPPGEVADFEALTDSCVVCIKFPSIPEDKVVV